MSLEQSVTALEQRNAELVSEVVRARDAVMGLSNMYTTITLGLAGTEDGQYFTVPGNGAYQKLYQHDGAQAPLITTYPNKSDLTDALTTLNTAMSDHVALPDPHTQYLKESEYEAHRSREDLLKQATLSLDFANNKYEVYEGIVDGMTARPFNDVLDFTRASSATARTATGKIQEVLTDEQRLVGNREGLLIEEQRTNLLLNSDFGDDHYMFGGGGTYEVATGIPFRNPFGGDVYRHYATLGASGAGITTNLAVGTYTFSVWVAKTANTDQGIRFRAPGDSRNIISELASDKLTRVSITFQIITEGSYGVGITDDRGDFLCYGFQLEQGSFPTSYIPTAGAQVTRATDNCVRVLEDEFNPEEGTLYAEAQYLNSNTTAGGTYGLTDGTSSQRMLVVFEPSGAAGGSSDFITAIITDANSVAATIPSSVNAVASGFHKVAISYNSTSFTFAVDGVIVGTASHAGVPTVDRIDGQGGTIGNNGTLTKDLYLFPTALSDAELTTLTGGT